MIGFTIFHAVAAASGLSDIQEIQEAQHRKAAMIPLLFVLFILLAIAIAVTKAALLYQYYRQQYGSKEALYKILLNPKSIMNAKTNGNSGQLVGQIKQALKEKTGQNLAFGFDTNILMYLHTEIFELLKNESILISRHVQQELDGLKNNHDKETAANARRAFKALGDAQLNGHKIQIVPGVDYKTLTSYNLADTKDDRIIASYLNVSAANPSAICFISNDNGAKITARNSGLTVLETREPDKTKPSAQRKILWGGGLLITVILILFVFQLVSVVNADKEVTKQYSNFGNKDNIVKNDFNEIVNKATKNPKSVYYPEYASEFEKVTMQSDKIIATLINLPDKERKAGTKQLRDLLNTLMAKYYPNVKVDNLTDHQVQGTFLIGQGDIRFGLLCLNYYIKPIDADLQEIIAFDSSIKGNHILSEYTNVNDVKKDLTEILYFGLEVK